MQINNEETVQSKTKKNLMLTSKAGTTSYLASVNSRTIDMKIPKGATLEQRGQNLASVMLG